MAFHPTNPDKFWVGAPSGGLWVTEDGGSTYTSNTDQMPTLGVSSIIVDPVNPNIMYIGTGDRDAGDAPGLGVFKSTDGGVNWTPSNTGMGSLTVGCMIMYPGNTNFILAATSGGIYRTTDAAANWTLVSSNSANYKDIIFHPTDPSFVFATALGNFYRSADAGQSWTQITSGLISNQRMVLGASPDEPDAVFCLLTGGSQTFQGIFKSTDKGLNFTRITSASHPNILGYVDGDGNSQATYDLCMIVNPNDADMILVGSICIHRSDDGGATFTKKAHWVTDVHADQHVVARNPLNGRIYEGHDGGLHYSDDYFETWTNISSGLKIAQTYRIGQAAQRRDLVMNGYQDNGTANYDAGTFTTIKGGDGMNCLVDYQDAKYAYATYISKISRSTNGGYGSWSEIAGEGINGINESGAWVTPYSLHHNDPNTMLLGYKNIWRSNNVRNNPPTWTKISDNLGGSNSSNYRAIAQSMADNDIFYGVRSDNNFFRSDNVNDATPSWTDLTSGLPEGSVYIADVTCHPTDPEIVYLIQSDKVYKSVDKGNSWTDISGTLPAVSFNCMIYDKYSNEGIYIGTKTGVFFKNADMSDWILYDGGLPVVDVRELEIYYGGTDSRLRAATYGRGLWETPLYHDASAPPVANFKANKTTGLVGETLLLEDLSANTPNSWDWTITPTSFTYTGGTNANSQHPQVIFNTEGVYNVSLLVGNTNGNDTRSINSYITVYNVVSPTCTPATQNLGGFGMGIYHVQLNTINKNSGQPHQDNPTNGYLDLITSDYTILNPGASYDLTVELGTGYSEYWNVYIDYNNDGDFLDTDEVVYVAPSQVSGEHTISITIPPHPTLNQLLRMRILCDFYSIPWALL
ncbi:MAG: YCF48-related protein [Bacteroidales bacterium]